MGGEGGIETKNLSGPQKFFGASSRPETLSSAAAARRLSAAAGGFVGGLSSSSCDSPPPSPSAFNHPSIHNSPFRTSTEHAHASRQRDCPTEVLGFSLTVSSLSHNAGAPLAPTPRPIRRAGSNLGAAHPTTPARHVPHGARLRSRRGGTEANASKEQQKAEGRHRHFSTPRQHTVETQNRPTAAAMDPLVSLARGPELGRDRVPGAPRSSAQAGLARAGGRATKSSGPLEREGGEGRESIKEKRSSSSHARASPLTPPLPPPLVLLSASLHHQSHRPSSWATPTLTGAAGQARRRPCKAGAGRWAAPAPASVAPPPRSPAPLCWPARQGSSSPTRPWRRSGRTWATTGVIPRSSRRPAEQQQQQQEQ